jgi:hypothetical protein
MNETPSSLKADKRVISARSPVLRIQMNPSVTKDSTESKKVANRPEISCRVKARSHRGSERVQTLLTPTVLDSSTSDSIPRSWME